MDNSGGFEAYDVGHSFDLGARTLEFGGTGSEEITTIALVKDYLETALSYIAKNEISLARSEVSMGLAVFNTVKDSLANIDPANYIDIKMLFTIAKRRPSDKNIQNLIGMIDKSALIIQGKLEPANASLTQQLLVIWGQIQLFVFLTLGFIAIIPVYRSTIIRKRFEFRTMGTFLIIVLIPIVLESIGRVGIFFKIVFLQKFSFMTSEYATLLWALLMAVALFIGRLGFIELDKALSLLKKQKEKLEEASVTDELTKIYNRRYFNNKLSEFFAMSLRYNYPMSLLLIDIDFFKKVNDNYGHQCGDEVIKEVAKSIKNSVRSKVDIPARYGGEEFAVILFNTEMNDAVTLAERIREHIKNKIIKCEDETITISVGISQMPSLTITEESCLIKEADEALYLAKSSGRNCVRIYTPN